MVFTNRKEKAAAGFEPANNGFANRRLEKITTDKTKTCNISDEQLTPQLTHNSQNQGKIDTPELPSDLTKIVAVWPDLPEHIRAAVEALIQTHNTEKT